MSTASDPGYGRAGWLARGVRRLLRLEPPRATVVTITPCAVEADSRTLKQAASVARFGLRSILVEGKRSDLGDADLGFVRHELPDSVWPAVPEPLARALHALGGPRRLVRYVATFGANLVWHELVLPAARLPRAQVYVLEEGHGWPGVRLRCAVHGARYLVSERDLPRSEDLGVGSLTDRTFVHPVLRLLERASRKGAAGIWTGGDLPPGAIHVAPIRGARGGWGERLELVWRDRSGSSARLGLQLPGWPRWLERRVAPAVKFARECRQYFGGYLRREVVIPILRLPPASLYHVHSPYMAPGVLARAWVHDARVIYDAHDFYTQIEPREEETPFERLFFAFQAWIERVLVQAADEVLVVSDGQANLHRAAFGRVPVVIRNCQDRRTHRSPRRGLREAIGLGPHDVLVVATGTAKDGQALEPAFRALTRTPGVHLAFVGRGHAGRRSLIQAHGLSERVHLVDAVRSFEVVPFIRSADAAVLLYFGRSPNYITCLPNGLFQSIDAELPLIYPDLPEVARLGDQFGLGIKVDPQSAEALAAAFRAFVDPATRQRLRVRAARAARALSWSVEELTLRQVMARTLRSGGADRVLDRPGVVAKEHGEVVAQAAADEEVALDDLERPRA